ncbi:MAG: serine/threonine-protein kinase, partial [Planctomycetota bacterium]
PILHTSCDTRYEYQVMPLLKGETLEIRLTRQRGMAPIEVARIGRELAAGLQRLHANGLVHHDIKPANIWLDSVTHRARLIDFGLAADYTDQATPATLRGTPAYHAPEVVQGMPYLPQSDLYSLGVLLYECATGQRHNRGATVSSAQEFILHGRAPAIHTVNPDFPVELAGIIERLLVRKTAARTKSAPELDSQLAAWLATEFLPSTQEGSPPVQSVMLSMSLIKVAVWLILTVVILIGCVALVSPLVMR